MLMIQQLAPRHITLAIMATSGLVMSIGRVVMLEHGLVQNRFVNVSQNKFITRVKVTASNTLLRIAQ